jgi:hypothetical protein
MCAAREDEAVGDLAVCVVCRYTRSRGGDDHGTGEVFICTQCQADAAQLFAIQDSIYGASDQTSGPTPSTTE